MRRFLCALCAAILLWGSTATASQAAGGSTANKTLNFVINIDESTVMDQLLYQALQRMGYGMTMDAAPMTYAIQMANSGEHDGIASQVAGIDATFPNLVMVPEQLCEVSFPVFVREDSRLAIGSWQDLSGLVVGHLFQKTYIINHLPSYTYVNKAYASLAPQIAESIAAMKTDGTYDAIVDGTWRDTARTPNLLHISSYYPDDHWDVRVKEGIMSQLDAGAGIAYHNIPLYSNRFRTEYEQAKNAYYSIRTLVLSNPPDVLVALDNSALSFVCNYYSVLFSGIPVVLCDVNGEFDHLWELGDNYTGIWETIPAAETAEMIKTLFPQTTELFVVNDYTETGAPWRAEIEQALRSSFGGMAITYNDNLPYTDLLAQISALPGSAAVLMGYFSALW